MDEDKEVGKECPKCKKYELVKVASLNSSAYRIIANIGHYIYMFKCTNCGYIEFWQGESYE